ncbi:LysR family transcriptional regulator [Agromyces sp. H66]|uniref:LysR family transcriptional regulator n=1 Tax=Agromyces sp. H66 TaxID=2529859 RepID=UPI0010A9A17B|nr:LysR family transcriptional regulator [Agromyces sp. H66]
MTTPRIDLVTLRALDAIARAGGVGAAAVEIGMSQQAVSARIRAAEERMGLNLLHRSRSGSTLTPEGQLIVEWGAPVLAAEAAFLASVATLAAGGRHALMVAASQSVAEAYMPGWIAAFRSRGVEADVHLASGNSEWVVTRVRDGRAQLGLIESPTIPPDLQSTVVGADPLVIAVAPTHAWAGRSTPLGAGELARTPLVMRERGSGTRTTLEFALAERGLPDLAAPAAELSSTGAIRAAIIGGVAPGVVSRALIADDVAAGRMTVVPADVPLVRPLTAIWNGVLDSNARAFLEAVASS